MAEATTHVPVENGAKGAGTATPARRDDRWDPFESFRQHFDRFFDEFDMRPQSWARPMRPARLSDAIDRFQSWSLAPAMDMAETDEGYRLTAELPGMDSDDIELTLSNGMLTLSGEKKEGVQDKKPGYVMNERRFGAFRRSFRLPEDVDQEAIAADFAKGVLTLTLPRSETAKAEERKIEVKNA